MPLVPIQPALNLIPPRPNIIPQEPYTMDLQYQYPIPGHAPYYDPQRQQLPPQHQPYDQYSRGYDGYDGHDGYAGSNSSYRYNEHDIHNSLSGSKQESPDPFSSGNVNESSNSNNNESDAATENQTTKGHKGKIFQCTGFGDCRMVFTRSEHLARHARKHTGEKPFQCVVEGCTRMFSRFDNMVQHTQTHTKGAHRETTEGIANKIAIESRRKSEAGLIGGSTVRRASSIKNLKSKRGSMSSGSGSETPQKSRQDRMQSIPMLNISAVSPTKRSSTPVLPSPVTPSSSSPLSPKKQTRSGSKTLGKDSGKIRKRQGSIKSRRGSLDSSAMQESWYASKLHHRPSLDYGLDQHAFLANVDNRNDVTRADNQLPPMNYYPTDQGHSVQHQASFSRLRHPLSPEHSPHSDDIESDDGSVLGQQLPTEESAPIHPHDLHAAYPLDNCTLPPLRTSLFLHEINPKLPPISYSRNRSQSIAHGAPAGSYLADPYSVNTTRRLSLVDLNAPIQEAKMATHHSMMQPHINRAPGGVDVSEDEIKALEAFGQLWSQGRDVEMSERRPIPQRIQAEFAAAREDAPVPGPDFGRRPMPPFGDDGAYMQHRPETSGMHLD
ncbi:hypothetical protein EDD21DRAFT_234346 [Dissophora ornata]|nr:hypothetical protein BGZ58_005934 [Dissophora ornata]KAI8604190.1 hypothetical protein EDD21DRAFT_234346 [Dissophora ornata]